MRTETKVVSPIAEWTSPDLEAAEIYYFNTMQSIMPAENQPGLRRAYYKPILAQIDFLIAVFIFRG